MRLPCIGLCAALCSAATEVAWRARNGLVVEQFATRDKSKIAEAINKHTGRQVRQALACSCWPGLCYRCGRLDHSCVLQVV